MNSHFTDRGTRGWMTVAARHHPMPALAFVHVAAIIALALFASSTPSPLYPDYAARWHFSTPILTAIFAAYACGALAALLLLGAISDDVGRRPVLACGLAGVLGSMLLFAIARSVAWLLVARFVQGLSTGAILSAGGAALPDLEPTGMAGIAGLVNGVCAAVGIGSGALVSSVLAQQGPDPLVTPFVLVCVLLVASLAGVAVLPEPAVSTGHRRLRPQRPHVPPGSRGVFALAGAGAVASWSIAGLYLALAPAIAGMLLHTESHLAGGIAVFVLGGAAGLAQVPFRRADAPRAIEAGSLSLAVCTAASVASISIGSSLLFLAATAVTGAGWGSRSWGRSARSRPRPRPASGPGPLRPSMSSPTPHLPCPRCSPASPYRISGSRRPTGSSE